MSTARGHARRTTKRLHRTRQSLKDRAVTTSTPATAAARAYLYRPLESDSRQIRVLRFEKQRILPRRQLRFTVETLALDDDQREPYYAISYAWGENPGLVSITLDGQDVLVPDSAEGALRGILRIISRDDSHQATLIWIDAVCIKQDDLEEKSHQVAMMGRVFAKAQIVFSWLGPDDGTTSAAIRSFEAFQQQCHQLMDDDDHDPDHPENLSVHERQNLAFMRIPPPATCDLSACVSFLRCSYFTRLWIVQEMVVSKRIFLIRGTHAMPLRIFEEAIRWNYWHKPFWFFSGSQGTFQLDSLYMLCSLRRDLQNGEEPSLFCRLFLAPMYLTSNAWDKVYALLGMTNCEAPPSDESTNGKIIPNYGKDLLTVYREATCKAIKSQNPLQVLSLVAMSIPFRQNDHDWPSWVPQLDFMTAEHLWGRPGPGDSCVDGLQQAVIDFEDETSNELHIRGICVGEVVNRLDLANISNTMLLEWLISIWSKDPDKVCLRSTAAALVEGRYQGVHVDDVPDLLADFLAFITQHKDECNASSQVALEQIGGKFPKERGSSEAFVNDGLYKGFLFKMQDGTMGVTNVKLGSGDYVCILFGNDDAFVLRQEGSHWKIRGLAYVPDVHQGEYIEQLRAEGRLEEETQTFILT